MPTPYDRRRSGFSRDWHPATRRARCAIRNLRHDQRLSSRAQRGICCFRRFKSRCLAARGRHHDVGLLRPGPDVVSITWAGRGPNTDPACGCESRGVRCSCQREPSRGDASGRRVRSGDAPALHAPERVRGFSRRCRPSPPPSPGSAAPTPHPETRGTGRWCRRRCGRSGCRPRSRPRGPSSRRGRGLCGWR